VRKLAGLCAVFLVLAAGVKVRADGMFIPRRPDVKMEGTDQRAVIWHDGKRETLIVSSSYRGSAEDFVWVVPVPSRPEVGAGKDELFTALDDYTRPEEIDSYPQPFGIGGMLGMRVAPYKGEMVNVVETKRVDIYDVTVLEARDSQALADWLSKNGYEYPESGRYLLESYINRGWYFVAAKVREEARGYASNFLREGHATPLRIEFDSVQIVYPLKISGPRATLPTPTPSPTDWVRWGEKWYKKVWTGTSTWSEAAGVCEDLGGTMASVANKKEDDFLIDMCGKGNFCRLGHRNQGGYCTDRFSNWTDGTPFEYQNWDDGEPDFACGEDCLDINQKGKWNNEWCDNHWKYSKFTFCQAAGESKPTTTEDKSDYWQKLMRRLVPTPGGQSESEIVNLLIYVFSDHKQGVPGWNVEYAGYVPAKTIEGLSVEDSGEPWMKSGKKMYVTKLTRRMKPAEMVDDVVMRKVDDDSPVGGGSGGGSWGRVGLILGLPLIAEVAAIVYILRRRSKK